MSEIRETRTSAGLSTDEAQNRLKQYGPNALEEKQISPLLKLLSYFWGPIPWMIELAAILSAVVQHWPDFWIIFTLLLFNAGVGFWQEYTAGNAVEALKKQLALKARASRRRLGGNRRGLVGAWRHHSYPLGRRYPGRCQARGR